MSNCSLLYADIIHDSESQWFISMSGSAGRQTLRRWPYRNGCHSMTGNCIETLSKRYLELERLSFREGEQEAACECCVTPRDLLRPIGFATQLPSRTISGA